MSFDAARSQLFIAHLGDGVVVVINSKSRSVLATIENIDSVHGTLMIPELNRVYATATRTNELVEIDTVEDAIVQRIALPGLQENHGLLIDPALRLAFIPCEGYNKLLVVTGCLVSLFD